MNTRLFAAFAALAVLAAACAQPAEPVKPDPVDPQPEQPKDTVAAATYVKVPLDFFEVDAECEPVEFQVYSNYPVEVTADADWISVEAANDPAYEKHGLDTLMAEYRIIIENNTIEAERSAKLMVICDGIRYKTVNVKQAAYVPDTPFVPGPDPEVSAVADILDVEFLPDGTARDLSGSGITFSTVAGARMSTYYNKDYKRYAAHFNTYPAGGGVSSGYYKADYTNNSAIKNKISDGHSIEMVVRLDCTTDGSHEIKAMCSQQSGGTGIMVSASGYGKCLTFLPNTSTNGASTWRWATSDVVPACGRYYHVVGVWDKSAEKARVYVNSVLKKEVDAFGNFNFATNGATWFCVGGDTASATAAESGWWGDIVIARVYDSPLTSDKVKELYAKAAVSASDNFVIGDLDWQAASKVSVGCKYNVFGSGFAEGDFIRFVAADGSSIDCESVLGAGKLSAIIPASLVDGSYTILVVRGSQVYSVGRTEFIISDDIVESGSVKCVAHRGYHPDNAHPENSIASLKYAQDLGVYGSEFDVWQTTDGGLFINHDGVLNNVTISASTTAKVENLTLANGEKIPTLRQYLEQGKKVPSVKMILELKHYTATDKSIALVKELGMTEQVEWISFDYNACLRVRAVLPNAVVQYLGGDKSPAAVAADKLSAIDYAFTVFNTHPEWIKEAHDNGIFVNIWTVNSDFASWMAKGVDVITTNQAKALMESLSRTYVEK